MMRINIKYINMLLKVKFPFEVFEPESPIALPISTLRVGRFENLRASTKKVWADSKRKTRI
jgi:hypothetical protein